MTEQKRKRPAPLEAPQGYTSCETVSLSPHGPSLIIFGVCSLQWNEPLFTRRTSPRLASPVDGIKATTPRSLAGEVASKLWINTGFKHPYTTLGALAASPGIPGASPGSLEAGVGRSGGILFEELTEPMADELSWTHFEVRRAGSKMEYRVYRIDSEEKGGERCLLSAVRVGADVYISQAPTAVKFLLSD